MEAFASYIKYCPSGRTIFRTILKIECLNSEFHSKTKMKSEIQGAIRFLIFCILVNIRNAKRLRDMEGMAGIDRPCTEYAAYRLSPMPHTVDSREMNAIENKLKKCTDLNIYENSTTVPADNTTMRYPTIGITERVMPVINIKRQMRPYPQNHKHKNKCGMKSDYHKAESNVFVYIVYGTLLMSTSVIVLLW